MWGKIGQLDQYVFKLIHRDYHLSQIDQGMVFLTGTGLGHVQLLIFLVFYKFYPRLRLKLLTIISYGAFAGLLRLPIMLWIHRERPSNFNFSLPLEHVYGSSSFPSGHATTSFAIAFSTWTLTRNSSYSYIGYIMLFWSIAMGYSRCYVGVHFPIDVLGAAIFALICNQFWENLLTKKKWLFYKNCCG